MNPDVVVDIGNSRMKWGRCSAESIAEFAVVMLDDSALWDDQCKNWGIGVDSCWAISDVAPNRSHVFMEWLRERKCRVKRICDPSQLPLTTNVESPHRVGIDRLLNAVAVNSRREPGRPAVAIDAGSAVTVDLVDKNGVFQGGAILPGLGLLTKSLHDYTALLPMVALSETLPTYPGKSTEAAIRAGVYWMVVGSIRALIDMAATQAKVMPQVFLAGGDGPMLRPALADSVVAWPNMTLEGIRLTANILS